MNVVVYSGVPYQWIKLRAAITRGEGRYRMWVL